jgi:hypothetical protein
MQVTLAAYYGDKPAELAQLIADLQAMLASALRSAFQPYQVGQVHGTLIGLEGYRVGEKVKNNQSQLLVDPQKLLSFARSEIPAIKVRVGGYGHNQEFPFSSRRTHPYIRSFSVQQEIAVAIGWPVDYSNSIDELRWRFAEVLNVRHKWHKQVGDCDNDFFFALGRIDHQRTDAMQLQGAVEQVRSSLAELDGVLLTISVDTLHFVAYQDTRLPPETSCSFAVTGEKSLTAKRLLALYPNKPPLSC